MRVPEYAETPELAVEAMAEIPMKGKGKGPITQLLFHHNSSVLLISIGNTIHSISLTSSSVEHSLELAEFDHSVWIAHPQDPELVVGFGPNEIRILDWKLVEIYSITVGPWNHLDYATIDKVLVTQDREHVLVQVSSRNHNKKERTLHCFKTADFLTSFEETLGTEHQRKPDVINPTILPYAVSSEIAIPLSFLSHNRLIFLSRDYSICSWQLISSNTMPTPRAGNSIATANLSLYPNHHRTNIAVKKPFKELFCLPGDLIGMDCLSLCTIWEAEICFLCPRNGEVAVVKCAGLV
ncbi:hypothetical protein F4820DRAFT_328440 [Hypoxylon rubiginosum]|uniref:Uncharacterized protein n=1 Tax=Hypoxylon rubiginosum TaxID=110542 RepID=A0ACB9YZ06_9PEZI|nr:hypothetical protein F4820DRAFT_328440 [Hypoxylon rubiginosum]